MATETADKVEDLVVEEKMEDAIGESAGAEGDDSILVLLCILQPTGGKLNRKIWRRIAVPATFSLLELHVALQNAYDWENMHLHNFQQPKQQPELEAPPYSGFGKTDVAAIPTLDVDRLSEKDVRTFQSVIGIEDAAEIDILTAAEEGAKATSVVYVQHSHPHQEMEDKSPDFYSKPKQILEERAFLVKDVVSVRSPALVYEYDYGMSHQVTVLFEGQHAATEGVNYPNCLAGEGASRAEDGNDLDEDGNLLPSYVYEDFAVLDVVRNFEHTYEDSWPVGPGSEDNTKVARCYMCRYNGECARRTKCVGTCCDYCVKSGVAGSAGRLSQEEADALYTAAASKVVESRRVWTEEGKCTWTEEDGQPCMYCSEAPA